MITVEQVTALPFHFRMTIPESYMDIFGHMNIQHYLGIFGDAGWVMFASLGMDEVYFKSGYGVFAGDNRLRYLREVKQGDTVACYHRLLARDENRLHFMQFMVNETRNELSTLFESLGFHVNTTTRRPTPFSEQIAATLDTRIISDNALDWPAPVSKAIQIS